MADRHRTALRMRGLRLIATAAFSCSWGMAGLMVFLGVVMADAQTLGTGTPAEQTRAGNVVGIPWTGPAGIQETIAGIMARETRNLKNAQAAGVRETHPRLIPKRTSIHDPLAPLISRFSAAESFAPIKSMTQQPLVPQTVGTNFLGAQISDTIGYIPPDSMGAVGPSQVLVIVNGRIKVFDKDGSLGPLNATTDSFFDSVRSASTSDPHVRYDRLSQRWFITMIDVASPNRVLIAVSSGPTITSASSFTFFQFQHDLVGTTPNSDTGAFADYDTLGVDRFALYIGVNVFTLSPDTFIGTTGFVVNKANLLATNLTVTPFRSLATGSVAGPYTPQGVDNDDPNATEGYFIGVDTTAFSRLNIRRISNPGGTPSISSNFVITVPTTVYPIGQVHKGNTLSKDLDALDDRLFAAAIHKDKITVANSLWTAHNIEVNSSGDGSSSGGRNGSRWYEIGSLTTTPVLIQSGTLFDSAASNPKGFWIPSVAASGQGHMALGCSYAGSNDYAGVATAGRFRTDSSGSIQTATLAVVSSTAYNIGETPNPHRWGDFSQVVVDPNDDMTMWTFQEYCNAANSWGVRAIQLKAPPPATPASASPASVVQGQSSVDVIITGTSASGSEFFDPGPDTGGPGFANHVAAAVNGGDVTVNSVTFSNPTNITINVTISAGAATGARTITVTNPDGQALTSASGILTIASSRADQSITNFTPTNGSAFATTSTVGLAAQASSSLPVAFTVTNGTGVITSLTNLTFTGAGAVSIVASQAGDTNWNPAPNVTNTFAVTRATATVILTDLIQTYNGTARPVTTSTVPVGLPLTLTYAGNAWAPTNAGSYVVTGMIDSGHAMYQGTSVVTLTVSKASQTITFGNPGPQLTTNGVGLVMSSDSGLAVTGSVISGSASIANGTNLTFTGYGNVTIRASQTGDVNYAAATPIDQTVAVTRATATVILTDLIQTYNGTARPVTTSTVPVGLPLTLTYAGNAWAPTNAGSYVVTGMIDSGHAMYQGTSVVTLTVNAPVAITTQPQSLTNDPGSSASFTVTATGTAPLYYQWQKNLSPIDLATNATYTIVSVVAGAAGSYRCIVSNMVNAVTSAAATLAVTGPAVIIGDPQSQTNNPGSSASFTVTATGTAPLYYQWQKDASSITSETNATYTIISVVVGDAGNYRCLASNMLGVVTSAVATLTVNAPPVIMMDPQSLIRNVGETASFIVSATGTAPLTYQWQKNGTVLGGATGTAYTIAVLAVSDAGNYRCLAANIAGTATSAVAVLTVNAVTPPNPPPSAPTGVSASDGTFTNKVRVTWNTSSGATSYEVWRHTSDSSSSASKISSPDPTGTNYDDTRATVGTTYYYWVKAVNAAGASGFSIGDFGWRAGSRADLAMVDHAGAWYIWFSSAGYQMDGPFYLGGSGTPVATDFDGDRYADPAMQDMGNWYVWFSGMGYQMDGPFYFGGSGTPVAADFDGDKYADPAIVDNAANWYIWFSSAGYQLSGPYDFGVSGMPIAADFDGDGKADLAMVDHTGAWYIWFSSTGYQMFGPTVLGVSGTPVAADFDGDGKADLAMVDHTGAWYIWFSSTGYQLSGPYDFGVSGTPVAADFDGQ